VLIPLGKTFIEIRGITSRDAAMLAKPGCLHTRCVVCGAPRENNHHDPPRSRIPKKFHALIPRFSLCGAGNACGCHGLAHHNAGSLTPEWSGRGWYAVADERGAALINGRRALYGKPPITPGEPFRLGE
jgi:hypothetical protein